MRRRLSRKKLTGTVGFFQLHFADLSMIRTDSDAAAKRLNQLARGSILYREAEQSGKPLCLLGAFVLHIWNIHWMAGNAHSLH